MVIVEGWFRFAPGEVEKLSAPLAELIAATREEPGCVSYAFARDMLEPNLLRVSEIWQDEAALKAHGKAPHIAAFAAALRAAQIEGMSVKAYTGEYWRTLMES